MSAYGYTTGYSFTLINYQTPTWQTEEYDNWRRLDGLLQGVLDQSTPFAVATGAVNTFVVSYSPAITAYTTGLLITFAANNSVTGAATVNVNGLGSKNLIRDGAPLINNSIVASDFVKAIYDGSQFIVIEPRNDAVTIADGSVAHTKLTLGHPTWNALGNLDVAGDVDVDGAIRTETGLVLSHNNAAITSGKIFFSTSAPAGGSDGDIWFLHAA